MVATVQPLLTAAENIEQWHGLLIRLAYRYAHQYRIETEEAYQLIVLHVLEQWKAYQPSRGAFSTWLHVVVPNAFRDLKRQMTMRLVPCVSLSSELPGFRDDGDRLSDMVPDPFAADPAEEADSQILREKVTAAIARIAPHERAVIEKRFWANDSLSPTERDHLRSAMQNLAEMLEHS